MAIDGGSRRGRCGHCGGPATHVVKWPPGSVWNRDGEQIRGVYRRFVCAWYARKVVRFQASQGMVVRAYRYRRV